MSEKTRNPVYVASGPGKRALTLLAVITAFLGCLALLPAQAHASGTVDKIVITEIVQPGIGAEPNYWGSCPEGNHYSIAGIGIDYQKIGWVESKEKPSKAEVNCTPELGRAE